MIALAEPYIVDSVLDEILGDDVDVAKHHYVTWNGKINRYEFNADCNTEVTIRAKTEKLGHGSLCPKLITLRCNLVLLKEDDEPDHFHFRIGMHVRGPQPRLSYVRCVQIRFSA